MVENDNPNDIEMVELSIEMVSGEKNPIIYANGRHQIPLKITAIAKNIDHAGVEKVLHFSHETWIQLLNLRFADSNKKLNLNGGNGWCYTTTPNKYTEEVTVRARRHTEHKIIVFYVYTFEAGIKRLAVGLDIGNIKRFTTSDRAVCTEKISISINSLEEIRYKKEDLNINSNIKHGISHRIGPNETLSFKCHYKNYYFSLKNGLRIAMANCFNYSDVDGDKRWISCYKKAENNHHMIVTHSFDKNGNNDEFGFDNSSGNSVYKLKQKVKHSDRKGTICYTLMSFLTKDVSTGSDSTMNVDPFDHGPRFELYDQYGNSGSFQVKFSQDLKELEVN